MNTWFRFYHEAIDDPKVQSLPPALFRNWVNMLCVASRHGGVLPSMKDICFHLRISSELATEILGSLVDAKLFDKRRNGSIAPHNWDARQYKSDSSTERVKRFRKRSSNVPVTADGTPPETDTDTESPIVPKGTTAKKKKRKGFDGYSQEFEAFWKAYPRKDGKGTAWDAWQKAAPTSEIIARMFSTLEWKRRSDDWTRESGQFVPHAATWINGRRWDDAPPIQQPRKLPL